MTNWNGKERRGQIRRDEDYDSLQEIKELITHCLIEKKAYQEPVYQSIPIQPMDKDITKSLLSLKDVISIIFVLGGGLVAGFGIWTDLNNKISENKTEYVLYKAENSRSLTELTRSLSEHEKQYSELIKKFEEVEKRMRELDSTLSQIYNKLSNENAQRRRMERSSYTI